MKQPYRWPGLVLLAALMLAGCEQGGLAAFDETVRSRLILNLPRTAALDGSLQQCLSVVSSAALSINGLPLSSQRIELGGQAVFPIEVPVGPVEFGVEIASVNQSLLYAGRMQQTIENDGFVVQLAPTARSPVMEACFETGTVFIYNRGRGRLNWEILPPPDLCGANRQPCVSFSPGAGILQAGRRPVTVSILGIEQGQYQARVRSDEGDIPFTVEIRNTTAR